MPQLRGKSLYMVFPAVLKLTKMLSAKQQSQQQGQTLVETMVAVFILVMGITAALGLATYSLNATTSIRKQIIAMGLAREGLEAVKNMRDTNWLQAELSTNCYNFYDPSTPVNCYPAWLNPGNNGYNIDPGSSQTYALWYDAGELSSGPFWHLEPEPEKGGNFGLDLEKEDIKYGLYSARNLPSVTTATSDYARMITITAENGYAPFDHDEDLGPRLTVTSQVWWRDKDCPISDERPGDNKCMITLQTYLTNWKNY